MPKQSTDNMNKPNGVDAVGETMKQVPVDVQSAAVPASEEFNGYPPLTESFPRDKGGR